MVDALSHERATMANRLHEHHRTLRDAEVWLRDVPRAGSFRVALVYPNLYYVGMSNLGFQAVFELLNAHPDVVCERAFLPDDVHTDELERSGSPLVSFDTATPLRDFDMVAFSVSFENDYLHVLKILRLAGIPLRAKDRGPRDPLVVLGGAAIFLNPEPLAPLRRSRGRRRGRGPRAEDDGHAPRRPDPAPGHAGPPAAGRLLRAGPLRGPLPPGRDGRGLRRPGHSGAAARLAGQDADAAVGDPDPPHRDGHEVHGRDLTRLPLHVPLLLGGLQLPARARLHAGGDHGPRPRGAAPHPKVGLVSTAVCDHPEIDGIVDDLAGMDYQVSVASLRLDDLTPGFVLKLVDTGVEGLTLAPECGSDRMRKILNKQFTNEDILARAEWIFGNGIQNLKLYYMAGLPFEGHGDIEAIVELTAQIREVMLKVARGRGRIGRLHPSVNPFVPKPGTPYQWLPMEDPKETDKKLQYLRKAFGKMPNVDAIIKSARTGWPSRPWPWAIGASPRPSRWRCRSAWTSRGPCARPARPRLLSLPRPGQGRGPALGHHRQRRQPSLLLARARQGAAGGPLPALPGDPGLHPLRGMRGHPQPLLQAAREVEAPRDLAALPQGGRGAGRSRPFRALAPGLARRAWVPARPFPTT